MLRRYILADKMGLGKTLHTIAFFRALKNLRNVPGPHLVVCPLSVLSSWMLEAKKWCPDMRFIRLHTCDIDERARLKHTLLNASASFDVALTTYEMAAGTTPLARALCSHIQWQCMVLDEGHKVKNDATLNSMALSRIRRRHTVLLTGTPLQNNLRELYCLMAFLYPHI